MTEAHCTPYSVHLGGDKLYKDVKKTFWWLGMKREMAEFVLRCLTCQKVKSEHRRPEGKLQRIDIPVWKREAISLTSIVGMLRTRKVTNQIGVVVDRSPTVVILFS